MSCVRPTFHLKPLVSALLEEPETDQQQDHDEEDDDQTDEPAHRAHVNLSSSWRRNTTITQLPAAARHEKVWPRETFSLK